MEKDGSCGSGDGGPWISIDDKFTLCNLIIVWHVSPGLLTKNLQLLDYECNISDLVLGDSNIFCTVSNVACDRYRFFTVILKFNAKYYTYLFLLTMFLWCRQSRKYFTSLSGCVCE